MTVKYESLGHKFTVGSVAFDTSINTRINVIKRREEIVYRSGVPANAANVAFVGGKDVSSSVNLSIADRSTSLGANRIRDLNYTTISGVKIFTISTDNFMVTDVFVDKTNTLISLPLFYKHTLSTDLVPRDVNGNLSTGVSLLEIILLDSFLQPIKVSELKIDRTAGIVYNNLESKYTDSGDYITYYVKFVVSDNGVINTHINLLDNETVYRIADFDDLTPLMTLKTDGRKVYLIEELASKFEVTLPVIGIYAFQPLATSKIEVLPPVPKGIDDSWFVRVTNGKFFTRVNGSLRKYFIAEFLTQVFDPEPPTKRAVLEDSTILSSTIIKLDQENIRQDNELSLYVSIMIDDANGIGKAAFTTDSSIVGNIAINGVAWSRWSNVIRLGIKSIDHVTGFIDIDGLSLKSTWAVTSDYYYGEDKYEFTLVNFNPITNSEIVRSRVSLFIDPDEIDESSSQTLYFLKADETGKVVESNWPDFDNNTEQWTTNGINLYYEAFPSWKPSEPHAIFIDSFTVEGPTGDFLVLGDVTTAPAAHPAEFTTIDSRRRGGGIIDTEIDRQILVNPEVQWYYDQGNWDGIPYPGNASYLAEVPVNILDDAGGTFTQGEIRDIIERHTAAGVYPVAKAYGIDVSVSGIYPGADTVTLEWTSDEY